MGTYFVEERRARHKMNQAKWRQPPSAEADPSLLLDLVFRSTLAKMKVPHLSIIWVNQLPISFLAQMWDQAGSPFAHKPSGHSDESIGTSRLRHKYPNVRYQNSGHIQFQLKGPHIHLTLGFMAHISSSICLRWKARELT